MTVDTNAVMAGGSGRRTSSNLTWRRTKNRIVWILCGVALLLVVAPVLSIVGGIIANAVPHWQWSVLTENQIGNGGGLLNAIEGTLLITFGVLVLAGFIGIAGGVYLAEYTQEGRGQILRGASEVLSGVPSIVLGYVGYLALVVQFHWGFSLAAAVIVLSILVVPYVTKTTEVAIRNVPTAYREGAEALGMRTGLVLRRLVLRPALPGIVTGLIVAAAISVGETAPLLYTAGYNSRPPTGALTHSPVGYLTYAVYTFFNEPYKSAHQLAQSAALLLIILVLLLIAASRFVVARSQRYAPEQVDAGRGGRRRRRGGPHPTEAPPRA
ncbi:MAG TPA: phosphate ABC transporter permease PstA [Acidimicrobiales bacterium]|nr:phosphate ABC transporter permease PstA [Acidimicrobiales bacterium]